MSALAAGGTLVPHATGGLIVSGASGYIAGTFLSTAAINGLLGIATTTLGAGALYLSGATASIIGSAGIFGTSIGSTGITGILISAGIISSTPIWIPVVTGGVAIGAAKVAICIFKLKHKVSRPTKGREVKFSKTEAQIIEKIIKRLAKKKRSNINSLINS